MTAPESLTICGVVLAGVAFDFVNGFHDAANSIATIVATRVLSPRRAVAWAAFFNVAAILFFGTAVAKTVGSGLIDLRYVTPSVILCGLVGAIIWGLATWWGRLPTSSSHALLGGYAGAAMAHNAAAESFAGAGRVLIASGWTNVLIFIVAAPLLGLLLAWGLMRALAVLRRRWNIGLTPASYKNLQLLSSAFLSLMHGSNDAQKTAGIIAGALAAAAGNASAFAVPLWALALSYGTMGLGTLLGGWRIVRTMGHRLTRVEPQGGVCAEGAAALSILVATSLGLPVSTTHVTTGAILGVGVAGKGRVRWSLARRIAWAWFFTIPAAALCGAVSLLAFRLSGGG